MTSIMKTHLKILSIYLVAALAAYYIVGNLLIGSINALALVALTISVTIGSAAAVAAYFSAFEKQHIVSLLGGILVLVMTCVNLIPHASTSTRVNEVLKEANRSMGFEAPVAGKAREIINSRELFAQNRAFIQDIAKGTAHPHEVLTFIDRADRLGVDSQFVAQNGIIRASDRQKLYLQALNEASKGNTYATSLLEESDIRLAKN